MSDLIFEKFPKIVRLHREIIVTEKLDGTNAQINFDIDGNILCGSRNRQITPDDDNYGFARWSYGNKEALFNVLGEGRHFGEWWGSGIQRSYNMDKKIFSLFHSGRWGKEELKDVEQLSVVPVLYSGEFTTCAIDKTMKELKGESIAAPGFNRPEGVVVFHSQMVQMFKVTFEYDDKGKPFGV